MKTLKIKAVIFEILVTLMSIFRMVTFEVITNGKLPPNFAHSKAGFRVFRTAK